MIIAGRRPVGVDEAADRQQQRALRSSGNEEADAGPRRGRQPLDHEERDEECGRRTAPSRCRGSPPARPGSRKRAGPPGSSSGAPPGSVPLGFSGSSALLRKTMPIHRPRPASRRTRRTAPQRDPVSGPPIAGPAIPPSRKPDCHRPVALPRWSAEDHPEQQAHRGHGEHRRADAADPAQQQQLGVALRQPRQCAADRHDADAVARITRSPSRSTRCPLASADTSRENARPSHRSGERLADPEPQ